jgi:hypothetical protein
MKNLRNPLLPDEEGHYSPEALTMDRSLRRHPIDGLAREMAVNETRRRFFSRAAGGIGALALASLSAENSRAAVTGDAIGGLPGLPNFAPKAKRCLYFHLVGAPPQMDTFDYKPKMQDQFDKDLP